MALNVKPWLIHLKQLPMTVDGSKVSEVSSSFLSSSTLGKKDLEVDPRREISADKKFKITKFLAPLFLTPLKI